MTTTWDDDSPQGRLASFLAYFAIRLGCCAAAVLALHLVHALFFFIFPRISVVKTHQKLFKALRICGGLLMFISYSLTAACMIGIIWSLAILGPGVEHIPLYFLLSIALLCLICVIYVLCCIFISYLWTAEFLYSEESGKTRVVKLCEKFSEEVSSTENKFVIFAIVIFIILFAGLALFFVGSHGLCLPNEPSSDISTTVSRMITRKLGMDPYCDDHGICYLYLLVPGDLSSQMHVVFHSTERPIVASVKFGNNPNLLSNEVIGRVDKLNNFELERYVSSVVLNNLEPGVDYHFQAVIYTEDGSSVSDIRKFRTAPIIDSDDEYSLENINFAVASDIGKSDVVSVIAKQIASEEPLFLAIGGDLAYENAFQSCYCRYDWLLDRFNRDLITPKGYTVPILASTGNHEAGGYLVDPMHVPFFLDYFPYSDSAFANNDYLTANSYTRKLRSCYHSHTFGNDLLMFIVLDSGHVVEKGGIQRAWLEQTLKNSAHYRFKVALYHIPLYPSRRDPDGKYSVESRELWGELFDQYGLSVGFENHDHVYKRTFPIRDEKLVPDGTVYLGDGGWGVDPQEPSSHPRWYLEKTSNRQNFHIYVTVKPSFIQATALSDKDEKIDVVTIF